MKNCKSILRVLRAQFIYLFFSAWLLSVPALATNVNVNCSSSNNDNEKAFHSINDALKTLDLVAQHHHRKRDLP
jgi:hypothetical protein